VVRYVLEALKDIRVRIGVCDSRNLAQRRGRPVVVGDQGGSRELEHSACPSLDPLARSVEQRPLRRVVEAADAVAQDVGRKLALDEEDVRPCLHPVDELDRLGQELHRDRYPRHAAPAVVLVDDDAPAGDEAGEEVAEQGVVDLPRLVEVEKQHVDRAAGPAELQNVTLVDTMGHVEARDVRVELGTKRAADSKRRLVREESGNRVRLDAEAVEARERRAVPRSRPVEQPGHQRDGRAAEKAAAVDDGPIVGVVTGERVEQSQLIGGEHRRSGRDLPRQGRLAPGTAMKE
jgi:hypothetical protein